MSSETLTGGQPVTVDGIRIDAPGLAGNVVVESGAGSGELTRDMRDQLPDQLRRALAVQIDDLHGPADVGCPLLRGQVSQPDRL